MKSSLRNIDIYKALWPFMPTWGKKFLSTFAVKIARECGYQVQLSQTQTKQGSMHKMLQDSWTEASESTRREIDLLIGNRRRLPSIMLHGVSTRCGSTYLTFLLGLHPDLHKFPKKIWELAFLKESATVSLFSNNLVFETSHDDGLEPSLIPALLGESFVAYLNLYTPENKGWILNYPTMDNVASFFSFFPRQRLVVLNRDGRDVVSSLVRSWNVDFESACKQWRKGALNILNLQNSVPPNRLRDIFFIKYEDAVKAPKEIVTKFCNHFELDSLKFPFGEIDNIEILGSSEFKEVQSGTWVKKKKYNSFQPIGRWHSWSEREKSIFKRIAGDVLIQCNYVNDNNW